MLMRRRDHHLWLWFVAVTALGATLAGALTVALWSKLGGRSVCIDDVPGPCATVYALMWLSSVTGAALGQAIVMRRLIARARLWPLVTVGGAVFGTLLAIGLVLFAAFALGDLTTHVVPRLLIVLALGPLCGFTLGWSQHRLLRPLGISRQWIVATTAAAFLTAPMYVVVVVWIDSLRVGQTRYLFSSELEWSLAALGLALEWTIVALATGFLLRNAASRRAS